MSKDAQKRIDDTINFLVGKVAAAEQQFVRNFLTTRITQFAGPTGVIKGISDTMSMNDLAVRGSEDERKIRRGLIMIELVGGMVVGAAAKTLTTGQLGLKFPLALDTLRWVADQNVGTGQAIGAALDDLRNNTLRFLQTYPLSVFGSQTDGSMNQYFVYEKPSQPDTPSKFAFYSAVMNKHFPKSPAVPVANVPGVVWRDVPNRGTTSTSGSFAAIQGTDLGTETIMLTTQFSGCSFCYKSHAGATFAAHIMPGSESIKGSDIAGGGKELARQLAGQVATVVAGNFAAPAAAGGQFYVFGRDYSNIPGKTNGYSGATAMTLIGIKRAHVWEFYSQEVQAGRVSSAIKVV